MEERPVFRAPKRRKIAPKGTDSHQDNSAEVGSESAVVVKRQITAKRKGTQFSSAMAVSRRDQDEYDVDLVQTTVQDERPSGGLQSRFIGAGTSTQVTNTDIYMTDFVDRAMAEKSKQTIPSTSQLLPNSDSEDEYTSTSEPDIAPASTDDLSTSTSGRGVPQPLSEVDLGPNTSSLNFARTAAALEGRPLQDAATRKPRKRKPRLGRDGRPLRPRPRKSPDTEDLARSALVEQVLHEHGLGTYDGGSLQAKRTGVDEAADERMAAEFQQQFLETMAERQERQQQRQAQSTRVKKDVAMSEGPRLGGSRSARAKMAAAQSVVTSEKK